MAVERIVMSDFSGGETKRYAASDFSERQWASLRGVVIEDASRIRSQWGCQQISGAPGSSGAEFDGYGFTEIANVAGHLVGKKADGTFWWSPRLLSGLKHGQTKVLLWEQITAIAADPNLHLLCTIPVERDVLYGEALLINGVNRSGSAYAVWEDGGQPGVREWVAKWPGGGPTDDVMPPADIGTMWADYLVLGNIRWFKDDTQPMSDTNNRRYPSALWFSEPTSTSRFGPLGVRQTTASDASGTGGIAISDLYQAPAGLLVIAGDGLSLLRNPANDPEYVPLRPGLGGNAPRSGGLWPHLGAVAWVDSGGRLYHTDGQDVIQLDRGTGLEPGKRTSAWVAGWMQHLLVANLDGTLEVLTEIEGNDAAWSTLITPYNAGVTCLVPSGGFLYFISVEDGSVWRYTVANMEQNGVDERGYIGGISQELTVRTRTLQTGGGHQRTFWHRVGFRGLGGYINTVVIRPGPALDDGQPTMIKQLGPTELFPRRGAVILPMHGPSVEASVEVRLEGDVQLEQVEVWHHQGRGAR